MLQASEEGKADLQQEMTKTQFEMANLKKPKINFCGSEIDDEEIQTDDLVKKLEAKLRSKEDMLNEAVLEFHSKSEELTKVEQENDALKLQNAKALEEIGNLQVKLLICCFVRETADYCLMHRSNLKEATCC